MSSFHIDIQNVINVGDILCDSRNIKLFCRAICKRLNLTLIEMFGREFEVDKGPMKGTKAYTYCCVLATSSLCIHTYPEARSLQIDIVSCVSLENRYLDLISVFFEFIKTENPGVADYRIKHLHRENFLIRYE